MWPNGWRLKKESVRTGTSLEALDLLFPSSPRAAQTLPTSVWWLEFDIEPYLGHEPGTGQVGLFAFPSFSSARNFLREWQRGSGRSIPGVPLGDFQGMDEPATCPPECGTGSFALVVGKLVLSGEFQCHFGPGCAQLAEDVGMATYSALKGGLSTM